MAPLPQLLTVAVTSNTQEFELDSDLPRAPSLGRASMSLSKIFLIVALIWCIPWERGPGELMPSPSSGPGRVAVGPSICAGRPPEGGAWVASKVSAIPLILVPDLDVDIPVLDRYRIGLRGDDRRQAGDLTGP